MSGPPDRLSPAQDDFYGALMEAHEGLSDAQSHALNARLVLLLANEIGDIDVLQRVLATGRRYADD